MAGARARFRLALDLHQSLWKPVKSTLLCQRLSQYRTTGSQTVFLESQFSQVASTVLPSSRIFSVFLPPRKVCFQSEHHFRRSVPPTEA